MASQVDVLTVLVATRNGAATWPSVLEALSKLEVPEGGWKLVVVDNASTDCTSEILQAYRGHLPLTYVFESQDGKNAALNTGLAFVDGDLVVFTDDDVFPRPDWLVRLRQAADLRPECSIFGGFVVPRWETEPPDWILKRVPLGPTYSVSNSSLTEGPTISGYIFGPNMAIRAGVFEAGYRFDPSIGPRRSGCYPMGNETELVRRLMSAGMKAWHVHGAVVEHLVRASQMRLGWIIKRARRFGRGRYRLGQQQAAPALPCWCGVPRHLFRKIAGKMVSMLGAVLLGDAEHLFHSRWELNCLYGEVVEARLMNKEKHAIS